MKLKQVQVQKFRNIIDSTVVNVESDITCLVGKNESGKTSFLNALYRLNPVRPNAKFNVANEYPAWLEKTDRRKGIKLEEISPIKVLFEVDKSILDSFEESYGKGIFRSNELSCERTYSGNLKLSFNINQMAAIKFLMVGLEFSREARTEISKIDTVYKFNDFLEKYKPNEENKTDLLSINSLAERLNTLYKKNTLTNVITEYFTKLLPRFIYFDKYSTLPYSVNIEKILGTDPAKLTDEELTARSLLNLAGAENDYLLNPDYERRKRELENVANALTQDVVKYWTQNDKLRVLPDITSKNVTNASGTHTVIDEMKIRIWDDKHYLSLPFNEHSTGFQWFFSFLAAFSEYEYSTESVIILLDEPGLGLHGKAQADFLKFIEERLAIKCQVIYSTHSPFMIQTDHLERVRIVEEKDPTIGSKVSQDVLSNDTDTLFPLQGALGYDLIQHLFINKNNVILEGTSDYSYIFILSDFLKSIGREGINEKWSLIPVGGADLIPTFVALLGTHLDMTVVVDYKKGGHQKLTDLASKGYLKKKRIITIGEILGTNYGDIEDLFEVDDYLSLYNSAFGKKIKKDQLKGDDGILMKICRLENIERFDHGKPADFLLRNRPDILEKLHKTTLDNFENLTKKINKTFKD